MDNWSEDCEQAAGEPEEGPLLLDVNAKMHKAKTFGAVYVAMQCQEPVCSALSRWMRQILHVVILLLCNEQLLERHASISKTSTDREQPGEGENVQPG